MTEATPWVAAPVAALLLAGLAVTAAALDAVLVARSAGSAGLVAYRAPLQETARLLLQRRRTTLAPDALLWRFGGAALVTVALLMLAVVPLGRWVVVDLPVGVVWFNAMDVLLWAAVWLAGWGANSVYGLVGGYRYLAQALSYELPLMFALVAPATAAASLRVGDIVAAQSGLWYAVWMPVSFVVYLGSVLGFAMVGPFGYPAARDIADGVLAEPSGVDRLLLLAGRHALMVAGAAFAVPLFLGGGAGPLLPSWLWSLVKTLLVLGVLVGLRRRLPTVRADRFAELGWLVALPLALAQVLVVSLVVLVRG